MARAVFVVDDDPTMGMIISAKTTSLGISVETALSARACLRMLDAAAGDLPLALIIDILMPYEDALDLMQALAARGCRVPIMLMSGSRLKYLRVARELGRVWGLEILDVFAKPVDAAQLQFHLRRLRHALSPVLPVRAQALLVDDDADARAVMSQMLRVGGFDVIEASNGEEALGHLHRVANICLVVTDFCLPRGNGGDLAIEVKRLYPKVKILLISGDPGVIPIREASFLAKPCRLRALVDAARAALGPGETAEPAKLH